MPDSDVFRPPTMAIAFDGICQALNLPTDAHQEREKIAARVVELARSGERDPLVMRERVLRERIGLS